MLSTLFTAFLPLSLALAAATVAWFAVATAFRRNDLADVAWGANAVLLAAVALIWHQQPPARLLLVAVLIGIWGIRLAATLGLRVRRTKEDPRYAAWREAWGRWAVLRSFFQVFVFQGLLLLLLLTPLAVASAAPASPFGWSDGIGVLLWIIGLGIEAVADDQLRRFKARPENKGRLMRRGLWAWSRHPNYFGEALLWWGIGLVAASTPLGALAFISPVTITLLLVGVSGVPMTERRMRNHPEFEDYRRTTSIFIPLPPRSPR